MVINFAQGVDTALLNRILMMISSAVGVPTSSV